MDDLPQVEILVERTGLPAADAPPPEALSLLEDGETTGAASKVRPFGESGYGTAYVVAVDVSGTMAGEPMQGIRSALSALVEAARREDRVALVTFADEPIETSSFGASGASLREAIEGLTHRGRITELYQALMVALDLFDRPDLPARRRLIVLSDGKDEGEAYRLDDVIKRARELRIPVDAIGLTKIDERFLTNLDRLARLSGGHYARAADAAELERLMQQGVGRLAATPVAAFTLRNLSADGQPHLLGVRLTEPGALLEDEIRVLFPPAQPPADAAGEAARGGEEAGQPSETGPSETGPPNYDGEPDWWRDLPWRGLLLAALALLLVALILLLLRRRRQTPAAMGYAAAHSAAPAGPERDGAPRDGPAREDAAAPADAPPVVAAEPVELADLPVAEAAHSTVPEESPPAEGAPPGLPGSRRKTQFRVELPPPAPGAPCSILVGEEGGVEGLRVAIETTPFWIGAEPGADLHLPDDSYLSGLHASLQFHAGTLFLYDNDSTNGTFLNGERLGDLQRPLSPGDRIKVGRAAFVLTAP